MATLAAPATDANIEVRAGQTRLVPLDALRGLIIVVMALDHANYFVARRHPPSEFWNSPIPDYEDGLTFLTRYVTHLAAPGFFFLMGAGMALFAASRRNVGWTGGAIARHFLVRGAILIALQLLIENRAWPIGFPPDEGSIFILYFGVLYALGAAMILGTLLLRINWIVLILVSLALIGGTQFLLPNPPVAEVNPIVRLLVVPGITGDLLVLYPVIPWLGVLGVGMAFGRLLLRDRALAYREAFVIGSLLLFNFVLIRATNGGSPNPFGVPGWIAFLYVVKYPPSVAFLLVTLGTDLLLLSLFAVLARARTAFEHPANPLVVFGRTALFFYLALLFLYAFIGLLFAPQGTGIPAMYPSGWAGWRFSILCAGCMRGSSATSR